MIIGRQSSSLSHKKCDYVYKCTCHISNYLKKYPNIKKAYVEVCYTFRKNTTRSWLWIGSQDVDLRTQNKAKSMQKGHSKG